MIFNLFMSKSKRYSRQLDKLINTTNYKDFILFLKDNESWLDNKEKEKLFALKLDDIRRQFVNLYELEIKNLEPVEKHDNIQRTISLLTDIINNTGLDRIGYTVKYSAGDFNETDAYNYAKSQNKFKFQGILYNMTSSLLNRLSIEVKEYYSQIELDSNLLNQLILQTFSTNSKIKEILIDIFLNQFIDNPSKEKFEELQKIIKMKLLTKYSLLLNTFLQTLKRNDNIHNGVFTIMFIGINKKDACKYISTVKNKKYYQMLGDIIPEYDSAEIKNLYSLYYMSNPLFNGDINMYKNLINDMIQEYWNDHEILSLIIKLENIKQIVSVQDFRDIMTNISNLQHKKMIEDQMYDQNEKLANMEESQNERLNEMKSNQQKELEKIKDMAESAKSSASLAEANASSASNAANSAIQKANSVNSKLNRYT